MDKEIFTKEGFKFVLFARTQQRMNVHIFAEHGEAKFWLEPVVTVAVNSGLSDDDLEKIEQIIWDNHQEVRNAWRSHKKQALKIAASQVEITQITGRGVWVLLGVRAYGDVELFVPYEDFPEFKDASEVEINNVTRPDPARLVWPEVGVAVGLGNVHDPKLRYAVKRL